MKIESAICILPGTLVLAGIALGHWVNPGWFLLTAFVGFNFVLSGFTEFCISETILRKLGVGDSSRKND